MKSIKIPLYAAWVLLTVGAVYWGAINQNKFNELSHKTQTRSEKIQTEATIIARRVDAVGLEHAVIDITDKVIPRGKFNETAISEGILDTARLYIESLKGKLNSALAVNSSLVIENQRLTKVTNNALIQQYAYADKYAKILVSIPVDTLEPASFDLNYNAELVVSKYSKKKWVFGQRRDYLDIYSTDARTTVNGVKVLSVKDKDRVFSMQSQAVGVYDLATKQMGIGPGLRVGLGKLSLQGSYLYFPQGSYWSTYLEGRYDLLRF